MTDNKIIIDNVNFLVNDNMVEAEGEFVFGPIPYYEASVYCQLVTSDSDVKIPIDNIRAELFGSPLDEFIFKEASFVFEMYDQVKNDYGLYEIALDSLGFDKSTFMKAKSGQLFGIEASGHKDQLAYLDNLKLSTYYNKYPGFKLAMQVDNGTMSADMAMIKDGFEEYLDANIQLDEVSTKDLSKIIRNFANVEAVLSGNINLNKRDELTISGQMSLSDGTLQGTEFFDWLSEYFTMPSLKQIHFDQIATEFKIQKEQLSLNNIKMFGHDLDLYGDYLINDSALITSNINLKFNRDLLAESPQFRPLLKRKGYKEMQEFDFGFRLSGHMEKINFQWTESELKAKMEETIPGFYKRRIESNIQESLDNNAT